jgi:hypothetical protein
MQDVTELSWLIDSSPSWNNFTDTKRVHALLNLRKKEKKKVMTLNLILTKYGFHN